MASNLLISTAASEVGNAWEMHHEIVRRILVIKEPKQNSPGPRKEDSRMWVQYLAQRSDRRGPAEGKTHPLPRSTSAGSCSSPLSSALFLIERFDYDFSWKRAYLHIICVII